MKCADFLIKHVKTSHPIEGLRPFPRYPFLREIACSLFNKRLLLIPKSRQMFISWLMCAVILYRALSKGGLHLLLSKNQFSADELLKRINFIFDNLHGRLQSEIRTRNRSELEFARGGRIISLPATEDAPRMHSPTSVFWDEMAFTRHGSKIWTALKPCLDNGAQFTGVSTPNGMNNIFADLVEGASENGMAVLSVHWKRHPDRDENWEREARKGLSEVEWNREYEISFEGSSDLVYTEFTGKSIIFVDILAHEFKKIYRSIDFGYRHPFVLYIGEQMDGRLTVFDEWEGSDATVEQMMSVIRRKDGAYGIIEDMVDFTSCDPAGAAVDSGGVSPIERLKRAGFKMRYRPSRILTGIEMVKSLFCDANGERRLFISSRLKKLTEDLRRYRWMDDGEEPEKDGICDHSLDALRYFAVNYLYAPRPQLVRPRVAGFEM